jgi:hypothetical protein
MCLCFWWENLSGLDQLKNSGVDVRIILKWIFRNWWVCMDCINRVEDRDRWLAVVNVVMNFGSIKCGEYLDYLRACQFLKRESAP